MLGFILIALLLQISGDVELNPGPPFLDCMYVNARSLKNKLNEFKILIATHMPDIVFVTESWSNESVYDHEFLSNDYSVTRKDRGTRGGGVLVAFRNELTCIRRNDVELSESIENEIMVVDIKVAASKVTCLLCYRPPNAGHNFISNLISVLDNCVGHGLQNLYMVGDFNLPNIN